MLCKQFSHERLTFCLGQLPASYDISTACRT